jgi:hypothetical protein
VITAFCVVWQVGINDAEENVASTFKAQGGGKKLLLNSGGTVTPDCVTLHHVICLSLTFVRKYKLMFLDQLPPQYSKIDIAGPTECHFSQVRQRTLHHSHVSDETKA